MNVFFIISSLLFFSGSTFCFAYKTFPSIVKRNSQINMQQPMGPTRRTYRISQKYHEMIIRKLNSKNVTIQTDTILGLSEEEYSIPKTNTNVTKEKYVPQIIIKIPVLFLKPSNSTNRAFKVLSLSLEELSPSDERFLPKASISSTKIILEFF